jgi:hypothetical protein
MKSIIRPLVPTRGITALIAACALVPASFAEDQPRNESAFGRLESPAALPEGRFRRDLENLPPVARERALEWLRGFNFTEGDLPSMHADPSGGVCFACKFGHGHDAVDPAPAEPEPPAVSLAAVPVSPFPASLVFHSRPGATNVIYVNFAGQTVSGTEWNNVVGRDPINALPFSTDTDYTTYSDTEQAAIKRIWQRMAEDFAPFDVNVTTEKPATFTNRTAVALITRNTDATGAANPYSTAGGVAYVNVFGRSDFVSRYSPAWVYHNNLSNNESYIAEAASHEIGHNLGLSHDGTTTQAYYGGHGTGDISWGPLMGTGYNRNVSQWSKGEYLNANQFEDDLAIIAGKIPYRTDDHGNTPGTATALVVTNGTQILSTTPENDPVNANPANKGVIERNTDVDVFSFVTGSGPVQLTANPWIMPAGTRGGNLDILLELRDEAGALIASSNPADRTFATIQTNLLEGRYYLYVRNTGTGTPLVSPPSGYTSYGSIGQYFISGSIIESTGFIVPPVAEAQTTNLVQAGQSTHTFTVTYSDDVAINVATIDSNDIRVTGPSGYDQPAQLVSLSSNTNGTPRTATYAVTPAGGGEWKAAHNGTYTLTMRAGQVADTEGAFVPDGELGQFDVAIPVPLYFFSMESDPGWTLQPLWQRGKPNYGNTANSPASAFSGENILAYNLSGNYAKNLALTYATTPPYNCSGTTSLTLRFKRWLRVLRNDTASIEVSTNGTSWTNVWTSSGPVLDTGWQTVQYTLPAAVAGSPTLRLRWGMASKQGSKTEIGWNIDDVEILGDGALDTTPPSPTLNVANVTQAGSPSHSCTVTFTDATAVRLSSLDSTDLLVSKAGGTPLTVEFIGADLSQDGSPMTGSYSISAPGGTWDAADNGDYTITLLEGAVEDTRNNFTPEQVLGTFSVNIVAATPGVLSVTPAGDLNASGPQGGPFTPDSITYTLSNTGETAIDWTATKSATWITLGAESGTLAAGTTAEVSVTINPGALNLTAGNHADTVTFTNTTNHNGDTTRGVSLTVINPGTLAVTPAIGLDASGPEGGPFTPDSITYTLSNTGETAIDWTATKSATWITLGAESGTLAAGTTAEVSVTINPGAEDLTAGNHADTVAFTNTTNHNGDTTRGVSLTVINPGTLAVTPAIGLDASGPEGGPFTPDSITYTLSNTGETAIDWTATKSATWITLGAESGTLAAGTTAEVSVTINPGALNLTAGNHADTVTFTNTTNHNGDTTRGVSLTVINPGTLAVTPAIGLDASGPEGGPFTPDSITYTLSNTGETAIDWTATKSATWITLGAESGTLAAGTTAEVSVTINPGALNLTAGNHADTVAFTNTTNHNGDTTRNVSLSVTSPPRFTSAGMNGEGVFQLSIRGTPGEVVVIDATTDFTQWTDIATLQIELDGTATVTDPESADLPKRFYRVRKSP